MTLAWLLALGMVACWLLIIRAAYLWGRDDERTAWLDWQRDAEWQARLDAASMAQWEDEMAAWGRQQGGAG